MMPNNNPLCARPGCALIMLLPMLLLSACATPSQICADISPRLPSRPAVRQPLPPLPYSASVRLSSERWQKQLTGTPATSKP